MRLTSVHMFSADCISALDWQTCASAEREQSRAGPWEWALHWHLLPLSVFYSLALYRVCVCGGVCVCRCCCGGFMCLCLCVFMCLCLCVCVCICIKECSHRY